MGESGTDLTEGAIPTMLLARLRASGPADFFSCC